MATQRKTTTSTGSPKNGETADSTEAASSGLNAEIRQFQAEYVYTSADLDYRSFAAVPPTTSYPDLKDEYANLWAEMAIRVANLSDVDLIVDRILSHKDSYLAVEQLTRVPWFVVAIIHNLEASGDFTTHLHNGDSLDHRTVRVPPGRPVSGIPPFQWEESAADALALKGFTEVTDWSVEHLAFLFESYNGFGYRQYHSHVKSPYLWSFSNQYTQGKYVADGQWSETTVSEQCGAMVLLKRLQNKGEIRLDFAPPDVPPASGSPPAPLASDQRYDLESPSWDAVTRSSMPSIRDAETPRSAQMTWDAVTHFSTPFTAGVVGLTGGRRTELRYDHKVTPQERGYWCGPAAAQVVLNACDIIVAETELALSIGTHTGGTDYIGLIEQELNKRMPRAGYTSVNIPGSVPTTAERAKLWDDLVCSIDAGWGVVMNWVAPESNYPQGVRDSVSPKYHGDKVFHYVAAMGYDDTPGERPQRAVWIADSGFWPFGYWCDFDQVADLIGRKGYTYAANCVACSANSGL